MNIFESLSRGYVRIHEPNISAFLGYLLDPEEDHGFKDYFLKRLLIQLIKNNQNTSLNFLVDSQKGKIQRNDLIKLKSLKSNFNIVISHERTYKNLWEPKATDNNPPNKSITKAKQIVDLIIEISMKNDEGKKIIILLENKVKSDKGSDLQLKKQLCYSYSVLKQLDPENKINIFTIFITPDEPCFIKAFEDFINKPDNYGKAKWVAEGVHLFWKSKNEKERNIDNIFSDMLNTKNKENFETRLISSFQDYIQLFIKQPKGQLSKDDFFNYLTVTPRLKKFMDELFEALHLEIKQIQKTKQPFKIKFWVKELVTFYLKHPKKEVKYFHLQITARDELTIFYKRKSIFQVSDEPSDRKHPNSWFHKTNTHINNIPQIVSLMKDSYNYYLEIINL